MEIMIPIKKLHYSQKHIYQHKKRFNVVCCGRRFGKTTLAVYIISKSIFYQIQKIGYYAPTYRMLDEVWNECLSSFANAIKKVNANSKQIILINGSVIDFWSLEKVNASRGRKYHKIFVDEAASIRNLKEAWEQVIRATLTDYKGDAWFFSTPKGFYNYFYDLYIKELSNISWCSFKMPTLSNPYIDENEIEDIKRDLPIQVFMQEYLAEFVNFEGNLFIETFDKQKHTTDKNFFNPKEVIYLSFDFNISNSVIVCQSYDNSIFVLKEYHKKGSDLETICQSIKLDFENSYIIVTGDASGFAGSAYTSGNISGYELIKKYLNLANNAIKTPASNPSHLNSRLMTNAMLKKYNILIHNECKLLIKDIEMVVCDKNGNIDKKDINLTHLLDTFRYYLWTFHYGTFKNIL